MDALAKKKIEITEYRLRLSRPLVPAEANKLRGYFGSAYESEVLLHHHNPDGSLRYDYPRIQFKVLEKMAHLIGIAEGGPLVERLWAEVDKAQIGIEELPVLEGTLIKRRELFGENAQEINYCFQSPWLALNHDNHQAYLLAKQASERQTLLERILVGNCLAIAKSLEHRVSLRLTADVRGLRETQARLKGMAMLAFVGSFRINFSLPSRIGIGKSVSRGFGTIERVD
jgi:hypothetical protein